MGSRRGRLQHRWWNRLRRIGKYGMKGPLGGDCENVFQGIRLVGIFFSPSLMENNYIINSRQWSINILDFLI